MSLSDKLPDDFPIASFDEPALTESEINLFRDSEVWPAINHLARRNFTHEDPVGGRFILGDTFFAPSQDSIIKLEARIRSYDAEEHGIVIPQRYCSADLILQLSCDSMTGRTC